MNNLIVIIGPTAIGKTSLSIKLANHFNCEIVSADSRQFYKEMTIGTAVPSEEELLQAPHHCIQHKSIFDNYTVGDFEKESLDILTKLFESNNYAILVGGSGLYVDAVLYGLDTFPKVTPEVREELRQLYKTKGIEVLQAQLKSIDSIYYEQVDIQNPQRVIRALEISVSSGQPYSSFLTNSKKKRPFNIIKIGVTADREIIYDRINQRVDMMLDQGLLNEVKKLEKNKNLNALNTVGYKEIFKHLEGDWDLNFAISEIKKNTRRFAKRQLTWNRKDDAIHWFDYISALDPITECIKKNSL